MTISVYRDVRFFYTTVTLTSVISRYIRENAEVIQLETH